MKHAVSSWQTSDHVRIFSQSWEPDQAPRAAVCLVHGFGEHSGRYAHVAEKFVQQGWACLAFDLRGHGQSAGPRGFIPSYYALLDDIEHLLQTADERFPHIPHFLYGHSMGGNLVLNHVLRRKPLLQGVIASSPWLKLAHEFSAPINALLWAVNIVWPTYTRSTGDDPAILSRDPAVRAALERDTLSHSTISARLYWSIHTAGLWALAHANKFRLPLLLMHGTDDRLISCQATQQFAGRLGTHGTLKLWEGFYHELHNDMNKEQVLEFLAKWIQQGM